MAAVDGRFVVAWASLASGGVDTSSYSIQGQRFAMPASPAAVPTLSTAATFALCAALLLAATHALGRRA